MSTAQASQSSNPNPNASALLWEIEHFQGQGRNALRDTIMMRFPNTPQMFWSRTCALHNGFFGCDHSLPSATTQYSTYFRLAVKTPQNQGLPDYDSPYGSLSYEWSEMGFLSASSTTWNVMICFNVPQSIITGLQPTLPTLLGDILGPYALHIPLLEQLVELYDMSVSYTGGTVDILEKELTKPGYQETETTAPGAPSASDKQRRTQLAAMFEISNHITHLIETTQIAAETIDRMRLECESYAAVQKPVNLSLAPRARKLAFLHSMLRGLSARTRSNEKELAGAQSLLTNMIAQDNHEVLQRLAASNSD
ncbi:hypothetical protein D6C78_02557 [Aureobasidium pullulans]|uniref:Uncharacterized protein n=1 Tax=Aureobasidium pullulans TaxID=5580 RepID=A0A4T0C052_AURPU|nr:hypothetical protein D6C78_02557 [Aureobasidium pullulans]